MNDDPDDALIYAAEVGDVAGVAAALTRGADACAQDDCALLSAASSGHAEIVLMLLDDLHGDRDGSLIWAAESGYSDVVSMLLQQGANVHALDDAALRWAAWGDDSDIVALLLAQPGHTAASLRATLEWLQKIGKDRNDAGRCIEARMHALVAEGLNERAAGAGLSDAVANDGGLGL